MKRAREEVEEQAAPMASSPTRNPGPAAVVPPGGTGEPRVMTMDDYVDFTQSVKRAFGRAKYHEFFDVLQQKDSIGARGVFDRMKVLLRGHPDLKRHFNMFLPVQYKLTLTDDVDQQEEALTDSQHGSVID